MKRAAALAWLCTLALGCTAALAERAPQRVNRASAGWPLGAFVLNDHRGLPFTEARLSGRWTLLLLGDRGCGTPCDAALTAVAGLIQRIRETRAVESVQVVMVSPAPGDEPARWLGPYLARFDPRFIGVHGPSSALQGLAADLGATLPDTQGEAPPPGGSPAAGSIWVVGPDAILRGELLPPFDVRLLTAEFLKIRARR